MSGNEEEDIGIETQPPQPTKRSLLNIATTVAVATLLSKIFGLLRQVAIAAAFGNGTAYGAYNFAYVIPGFLLILLGGINGPFHSAIVSVLAKRDRREVATIIDSITTIVTGFLLLMTIALVIFAEPLMHLVAPGLFVPESDLLAKGITPEAIQNLKITKDIAIQQFQIMAPMAVLAGLVGIGFGALNASDTYWLPSVSPIFSSLTVLIGIGGLVWTMGNKILLPENAMLGGAVLAWSTLAGAVMQWLVQLPVQIKSGMGGFKLRFDFQRPEVKEVMKIMVPATFSSGMLQINVWTDLFFASFIPNAAAEVSAMGYAGLLVQTPLGILSNVILVPLFPVLSKLTDPENLDELKQRIRQGLMLTALTMLPLSALMVALALPISQVVYERYAFDTEASQLTATVLMAYSVGMFVYLGRDVLVRVFYALGDGDTPFKISIVNIFLNGLFDYLLVQKFGASGLVLATVAVNVISMIVMMYVLDRRLNGMPLKSWSITILGLVIASVIAGGISWGLYYVMSQNFANMSVIMRFGAEVSGLLIASAVGLIIFGALALQMKIPEINTLTNQIKRRFSRK
ncbi:MAG: murein biosynthesis integral membrane protein MurJ [Pseudanabaena sp.]|uniref:murein biosynthesis integral membrane protein MurJ n=1 Tax=Pseudanabaena mucicola TaxID=71190 RepID=UPI0025785069|nr:murein biosynthesis integral membrane protein MurJ [Pseudanabaena mucicola]MCA6587240.1 murein biosynthesis integral membrane protein MurJ [Pseudanabaena sp. M051S1SP1A06QC]MCA6589134.1 murein biosynthesis integral membrane protein MurJ [Pseudanabaena sp. M109S1SP1A06QC]MCA6595131.1 murein biosynthesis integral membrane protein MurJ [Pseudanabaena sp. M046S1SP1A06QC]MCA6611162.1 murein biosynthesis integral membrane protein MurJ [Pseudanabaena sp. M158S2SP1A06QC]MCA6614999.1 murein biosynth